MTPYPGALTFAFSSLRLSDFSSYSPSIVHTDNDNDDNKDVLWQSEANPGSEAELTSEHTLGIRRQLSFQ